MTGRWGMGIMRQNLIITRSKSNGLQVSVLKQSKYCQDYIVPFSSLFVLVLKGTFITNKKNNRVFSAEHQQNIRELAQIGATLIEEVGDSSDGLASTSPELQSLRLPLSFLQDILL
jgi:hypothetical protein